MEAIRIYINNLFESLAKSPEAERLRLNMLRDSEERFDELRDEGHSEAEALGLVIQHFGNFEDIRAQFGGAGVRTTAEDEEKLRLKRQTEADYQAFRPRFAMGIALGVFLCIIAIVAAAFVSQNEHSGGLAALAFFLPVGLGVALFIFFGLQKERYQSFFRANRMYEYLDEESYEKMRRMERDERAETKGQSHKSARLEALSGGLWLLTTVVYLLLGFLGGWWHPGWLVFLAAAALQTLMGMLSR